MRTCIIGVAVSVVVALAACGDKDREVKPVEETVFGDMVDNKRKAQEGVDKAMDANRQKLEEAMSKQEAAE